MTRAEDEGEQTEGLAGVVAGVIANQVRPRRRAAGGSSPPFADLEARVAERWARGRRRRASLAAATVVLTGLSGIWVRTHFNGRSPAPISLTVDGRPVPPTSVAPEVGSTTASVLSFSDGTRIELAARARGRLLELTRHGGRVALDEGRAHVQVAHRHGAAWLFQAGPFAIAVHGTAFSVAWNSNDAHLDLLMETGVVSVTGPVAGGEIVLRAGERLSIGLRNRAPAAAPIPSAAPAPAQGKVADSDVDRPTGRPRPSDRWPAVLADGHAAAVVAEARRLGISSVLASRSSEDLAALADAARFQRDAGLARQALLAQRRRFAGSARAAEALFLLGRVEDETSGASERALAWYDRYLAEAPNGADVSEALGRKMMVLERKHRRQEAAAIAAAYLQRFPRGTYAAAAEALVSAR